ncbi:MAG: FABP family protein [Fulvivirga sp.]
MKIEDLKTHKLHYLLGTWEGQGEGKFPTINSFTYREVLTFRFDGLNDLIHYEQQAWLTPDQSPSHWESGFIKAVENEEGIFEISNSQDSGRVEVLRGEYRNENGQHILHLKSKILQNDSRMKSSERKFASLNNKLSYIVYMATQNTPEHQQHLKSELTRK